MGRTCCSASAFGVVTAAAAVLQCCCCGGEFALVVESADKMLLLHTEWEVEDTADEASTLFTAETVPGGAELTAWTDPSGFGAAPLIKPLTAVCTTLYLL